MKKMAIFLMLAFAFTACQKPLAQQPIEEKIPIFPPMVTTGEAAFKLEKKDDTTKGFTFKNGKMMVLKNDGSSEPMVQDTVLADGTEINTKGKVITADGRNFLLTEGQIITVDGQLQ